MFPCPRCREDCISCKDKYLAGLWRTIGCSRCGAKLCANPWILMVLHMTYVWNVLWFYGLYHFGGDPINFAYMAIGWVVLDVLNVLLVPLSVMRQR